MATPSTDLAADNEAVVAETTIPAKRVNVVLTEEAFHELQRLAVQTRRSMTEILRFGFGLVRLALDERARGNKLVIADSNNKPQREIVLPL